MNLLVLDRHRANTFAVALDGFRKAHITAGQPVPAGLEADLAILRTFIHDRSGQRSTLPAALSDHDPRGLMVSVRQAAGIAGLSERHLARLLAEGELPSIKIGRRRLVRFGDLVTFLDNHRRAA